MFGYSIVMDTTNEKNMDVFFMHIYLCVCSDVWLFGIFLKSCIYIYIKGIHIFMYKNRLLWLTRERPQASSAAAAVATSSPALERIQISTFGRSRNLLEDLVLNAQKQYIDRDLSRTVVYAAGKVTIIITVVSLCIY